MPILEEHYKIMRILRQNITKLTLATLFIVSPIPVYGFDCECTGNVCAVFSDKSSKVIKKTSEIDSKDKAIAAATNNSQESCNNTSLNCTNPPPGTPTCKKAGPFYTGPGCTATEQSFPPREKEIEEQVCVDVDFVDEVGETETTQICFTVKRKVTIPGFTAYTVTCDQSCAASCTPFVKF